jgi:hypothetical protein
MRKSQSRGRASARAERARLVVEYRPTGSLRAYQRNARTHGDAQVRQIRASIDEFGFNNPILLKDDGVTIGAGHGRWAAAQLDPPLAEVPTITLPGLTERQWRAYVIADNKLALNAGWDEDLLRTEVAELLECDIGAELMGFDDKELEQLMAPSTLRPGPAPCRSGSWGCRSRCCRPARAGGRTASAPGSAWASSPNSGAPRTCSSSRRRRPGWRRSRTVAQALAAGRTYGAVKDFDGAGAMSGTSIFDPVLCELAYRWFCPPGGVVLDPFAGGSVGVSWRVKLVGLTIGIDLRAEQVEANRAQAAEILAEAGVMPTWCCGDSLEALDAPMTPAADFVFSCPPYADLEVYSDDPRDLSAMEYPAFVEAYRGIVAKAAARLKPDRFACFIVGDIRDGAGLYRDFVGETIRAFRDAGLALYNEAILVTAVGSLPIRTGKQFAATRKLGKTHQNVLVFVKGDPRRATEACGDVEVGDIEAAAA